MKQRKDLAATVMRIRENGDYTVIRYNKLITTPPKNWVNRKKEFQTVKTLIKILKILISTLF